jgi:hypothetical protein
MNICKNHKEKVTVNGLYDGICGLWSMEEREKFLLKLKRVGYENKDKVVDLPYILSMFDELL